MLRIPKQGRGFRCKRSLLGRERGISLIHKVGQGIGIGLLWVVFWGCSSQRAAVDSRKGEKPLAEAVAAVARSYLGTPYRYGGMDRKGMDCSGLAYRVYQEAVGIELPRTADGQALIGKPVKQDQLRPGDLVFFREPQSRKITHVGIVSRVQKGEVKFIHASTGRRQVVEDSLMEPHWQSRFVGARRLLPPSKGVAHTGPRGRSKS